LGEDGYQELIQMSAREAWQEIPGIYKARFRELWRVLGRSLLAAIVALATVVLLPLVFGFVVFAGHVTLTAVGAFIVLLVSGWLYWNSLKLALKAWKGP
jgi:hypothetical protein